MITLNVNGRAHEVDADPKTPLLYVLRNELKLNGAKFGCGLGQCGACTVMVDGEAVYSCLAPILLLQGRAIAQSRHHIPFCLLLILRIGLCGTPEVHQRVRVVIRLLCGPRRRQKSHSRRHHADNYRGHVPPADPHGFPYDLRIAVERPLPELVPQQNRLHGSQSEVLLLKTAAHHRLQSHYPQIILRYFHSLDRLASLIADEEVELPAVAGNSAKRLGFFLPFHPLLCGPAAWVLLFLPARSRAWHEHELLRVFVGWRGQQHTLNQAEHRRSRPDSERQRQYRNQAKAGLFQ